MAPLGRHYHKEIGMKRRTISFFFCRWVTTAQPHPVDVSLHSGMFEKEKVGEIPLPTISVNLISSLFSRPPNSRCHLIRIAHLCSLFLSTSRTREMSRLCSSVHLPISYIMKPVRVERLSPQCRALRDLLKPSALLPSTPLNTNPSNGGIAFQSSGLLQVPFVDFSCHVCYLFCVVFKWQQGNRSSYPGWVFKNLGHRPKCKRMTKRPSFLLSLRL